MHYWEKFVQQSMCRKMLHVYGGPQGNGYEYRGPETVEYKETLHISLPYQVPAGATGLDQALIGMAKELILALKPVVQLVGCVMSKASGIPDLDALLLARPEDWVLRMINYPADPREIRAEEHPDKGVTIHIAATAEGLQIFWNGKWVDVAEAVNAAYGYMGLLGQYQTQCILKALLHRVRSCTATQTVGRRVLVLFVDASEVRYNKDAYGRAQSRFPDDAHYRMSFDEFSKLFIPKQQLVLT